MTVESFENLLTVAALSKKEFSNNVDMNYNSVVNWNKSGNIPNWVESWLNLYIENKKCEKLKSTIREAGVCNE